MKKLAILFFLLTSIRVCGQSFYVVDTKGQLYRVLIDNSGIATQSMGSCTRAITSIAKFDNTLYYTNDVGLSLSKGTLTGNNLTNCVKLGDTPVTSSLTVDNQGILYLTVNGGTQLATIDAATMKQTTLGTLPYTASGDLLFYKGNLYLASNFGIVKVNISNPAQSTLVIPSGYFIFGLAAVGINSTTNKIYALASGAGPTTDIIEVDLDNYHLRQTVGTLPFLVFDAASDVEDGRFLPLSIDDIKATADCPFNGNGTIQVICKNASTYYQYTLNNSVTNSTGIFSGLAPGTYTIAVTAGPEQVTATKTITAFDVIKPIVNISKTNPACVTAGQISFSDQADAGLYNIRYHNQVYNLNYTFDNLPPGTYHFSIETAAGACTVDQMDVTLTQAPCNISVDKVLVTEECQSPDKANVTVLASPGDDTYTYNLNNVTNITGVFDDIPAGDYTLNVTSKGGGNKAIPVNVPDFKAANATAIYTKTDGLCEIKGDIKFNISTPPDVSADHGQYNIQYNYILYPLDHDFSGLDEGTYHFNILKPGGCVLASLDIPITRGDCQEVTFPNAFSPNGDGVNDIFRPGQNGHPGSFKFFVYNRLGTLVFKSDDSTNGWDGQYNGKPAPTGTYYWTASYLSNTKKTILKSGYVALIR